MVCPHCGTQVPEAQLRCPNCGKPLAPPLPVKKAPSKAVWLIVGCALVPVFIAIVGIIAAILIPNFLDAMQKAKQKRTVTELQAIGQAVETFKAEHGAAPSANDMSTLVAQLGTAGSTLSRVDAWRHPLRYGCWREDSASGCDHYRIVSGGRDGRFEQEDLRAYEAGPFDPRQYDRDIVFGDGTLIAGPGAR